MVENTGIKMKKKEMTVESRTVTGAEIFGGQNAMSLIRRFRAIRGNTQRHPVM